MSDTGTAPLSALSPEIYGAELEEKMAHLLASSDPLSAVEFDLHEQLNLLFPNDTADEVYGQTKTQLDRAYEEWRASLRGFQSIDDDAGDTALDVVHKHIQLVEQVDAIYRSAEQSETAALEMTKDVKRLDTAKKNLTETITVLRRLHTLVTAAHQLDASVREKQHAETAQLLKAISQLFEQVDKFAEIEQLKQIRQEHAQFLQKLSDQLFREFTACFHAQGVLVQTKAAVQDICLVAEALDEAFRARLIEWYTKAQLQEYRNIFCGNEEVASLEGVPRRYTWLRRLLKMIEDEHGDLFPASWHVARGVADEFCRVTRLVTCSEICALSANAA
ncbi:Vps53-like protein [Syncephalis pseudoplumigaleata]|uniref:Vps53-like protein n=1 Tax=Syncephalis pseudoplumigaleata TaxID=1712513 RepID=A0A4P9YUY3_9FUNG|nr:Vps53-like protein [Syncephalis pseudoplumigaleata]|eukprot:RKP22710.1 Vps53-like protein [Syncephalis pseudoplumigaleata]